MAIGSFYDFDAAVCDVCEIPQKRYCRHNVMPVDTISRSD